MQSLWEGLNLLIFKNCYCSKSIYNLCSQWWCIYKEEMNHKSQPVLANYLPVVFCSIHGSPIHFLQSWLCWFMRVTLSSAAATCSSCTWGAGGWPGSRQWDGDGRAGPQHLQWGTGPSAQPVWHGFPVSDPGWLFTGLCKKATESTGSCLKPCLHEHSCCFYQWWSHAGIFLA